MALVRLPNSTPWAFRAARAAFVRSEISRRSLSVGFRRFGHLTLGAQDGAEEVAGA